MEGCLKNSDVVIVGGGHNGLVAACYLAEAGLTVTILERLDHTGGAAVSQKIFNGVDVRLSKYSYLVSLLPRKIIDDLRIDIKLISREVSSYTPAPLTDYRSGLLVERPVGAGTEQSFKQLTGNDADFRNWVSFYSQLEAAARAIAPSLLEPLVSEKQMREMVTSASDSKTWSMLAEEPIGTSIEQGFSNDLVRGVIATDGLIGTFADLRSPDLLANRCFIYHVIGNGTGEWLVPEGGMGAITDALRLAAVKRGVQIKTGVEVELVKSDGESVEVTHDGQTSNFRWAVLNNGDVDDFVEPALPSQPGAQMKVNMILRRLPRLKSGVAPELAFGGTFHLNESYSQLQDAFTQASKGQLPNAAPFELYCHTLADRSIIGATEPAGTQTLTLFGLHTPITLFDDNDQAKAILTQRYLDALDEVCIDSFRDCLALDADGDPCVAAESPVDLARDLRLPHGNIFHGDLDWPWVADNENEGFKPGQWGSETKFANVFICGARAKRGGAVSGIGGRNAAYALLTQTKI